MKSKCPICGKTVSPNTPQQGVIIKKDKKASFLPFCSERCKLIDLNAWFEGSYTISSSIPEEPESNGDNSENKLE